MELEKYLNLDPDVQIINRSTLEINAGKSLEYINKIKSRGNFLLRQEINDHTPLCTPKCIIFYHLISLIIFLSFGIPICIKYKSEYYEIQYDTCSLVETLVDQKITLRTCNINFEINKTLTPPIYIYYRINNFYSNHREFVKSKSYDQLRGKETNSLKNCGDLKKNKDYFEMADSIVTSFTGETLDSNGNMDPCGLIAANVFTDEFTLKDKNGNKIFIDETGIAYESDKKYSFKNNKHYSSTQWLDKENEHFMVWMNMELFPNFLKKWGRINSTLEKGTYSVEINWKWGNDDWNIKKYFVLAKSRKLGNVKFFGYILIVGAVCDFVVICLILCAGMSQKKFFPQSMKWN